MIVGSPARRMHQSLICDVREGGGENRRSIWLESGHPAIANACIGLRPAATAGHRIAVSMPVRPAALRCPEWDEVGAARGGSQTGGGGWSRRGRAEDAKAGILSRRAAK